MSGVGAGKNRIRLFFVSPRRHSGKYSDGQISDQNKNKGFFVWFKTHRFNNKPKRRSCFLEQRGFCVFGKNRECWNRREENIVRWYLWKIKSENRYFLTIKTAVFAKIMSQNGRRQSAAKLNIGERAEKIWNRLSYFWKTGKNLSPPKPSSKYSPTVEEIFLCGCIKKFHFSKAFLNLYISWLPNIGIKYSQRMGKRRGWKN